MFRVPFINQAALVFFYFPFLFCFPCLVLILVPLPLLLPQSPPFFLPPHPHPDPVSLSRGLYTSYSWIHLRYSCHAVTSEPTSASWGAERYKWGRGNGLLGRRGRRIEKRKKMERNIGIYWHNYMHVFVAVGLIWVICPFLRINFKQRFFSI